MCRLRVAYVKASETPGLLSNGCMQQQLCKTTSRWRGKFFLTEQVRRHYCRPWVTRSPHYIVNCNVSEVAYANAVLSSPTTCSACVKKTQAIPLTRWNTKFLKTSVRVMSRLSCGLRARHNLVLISDAWHKTLPAMGWNMLFLYRHHKVLTRYYSKCFLVADYLIEILLRTSNFVKQEISVHSKRDVEDALV